MADKGKQEFHLRRGEPGQRFTVTLADGKQHNFKADDDGVVAPKSAVEDRALRAMGLPVARTAEAEAKTDESEAATKSAKEGKA
jgi:hypothetical protein